MGKVFRKKRVVRALCLTVIFMVYIYLYKVNVGFSSFWLIMGAIAGSVVIDYVVGRAMKTEALKHVFYSKEELKLKEQKQLK